MPAARADGVHTGGSRTVRIDGRYEVWVKQVGTGAVPVLTLHGGPGFNHYYLECFEDFLPQAGIRFWYYDQLGCGFSDAPDDAALWTLERYLGEVEQVRRALALERFVLYGHSWGGLLAMEYALRYPQHLSGLVISNMTASVAEYVRHAETMLARLPGAARATIQKARAAHAFESPEYQKVLMEAVYSQHVCRLDPWPEPVQRTFRTVNGKIYNIMQGPDEFTITGNLKNWDIWEPAAADQGADAGDRGAARRDGPGAAGAHGQAHPARSPGRLRARQPHVHVRRPAGVLPGAAAVPARSACGAVQGLIRSPDATGAAPPREKGLPPMSISTRRVRRVIEGARLTRARVTT